MMENDDLRREECEKFLESLSAYLDGELDAAEVGKIKNHIDNCAECRALYERFAALSADIKNIKTEIPADLHSRIMTAVRGAKADGADGKKGASLQTKLRRYGLWLGAGAAAVICLAMIGSPIFRGGFGMDLAKNENDVALYDAEINYAAEEHSYYAGDLAEDVPEKALEVEDAVMEAQMGAFDTYSRTENSEHYYSASGGGVTKSCSDEVSEEIEGDDMETAGSKVQSSENKDKLLEILDHVMTESTVHFVETESEMPEIAEDFAIQKFFPARGELIRQK